MKLLFLFDKEFDFQFLQKTLTAFKNVYFSDTTELNNESLTKNAKEILLVAKTQLEQNNGESKTTEEILNTPEYKSLLFNFNIFHQDLNLFCQELQVLEETIQSFLSQMWILQSQINISLESNPLFSRDFPGSFKYFVII
jgi:hypothetical protein